MKRHSARARLHCDKGLRCTSACHGILDNPALLFPPGRRLHDRHLQNRSASANRTRSTASQPFISIKDKCAHIHACTGHAQPARTARRRRLSSGAAPCKAAASACRPLGPSSRRCRRRPRRRRPPQPPCARPWPPTAGQQASAHQSPRVGGGAARHRAHVRPAAGAPCSRRGDGRRTPAAARPRRRGPRCTTRLYGTTGAPPPSATA